MMNSVAALLVYYAEFDHSCSARIGVTGLEPDPSSGCSARADALLRGTIYGIRSRLYDPSPPPTDGLGEGTTGTVRLAFNYDQGVSGVPNRGRKSVRHWRQLQKAPISVVSHSFRLIFRRAIVARSDLEAWMFFSWNARARNTHV